MRRLGLLIQGFLLAVCLLVAGSLAKAQTGNSGTIAGTVTDPSGAVIAAATVTIHNAVSGFERSATTDSSGNFSFTNVPFNPYHLTVAANGFGSYTQDVEIRSAIPLDVKIALKVVSTNTTVTVEGGGDLIENDSTSHTDVDRGTLRQASARKRIFLRQLSGHSGLPRHRRRFQRPLPWTRRPRLKFLLGRRPAHHRSAEQGFLEPDSRRLHSVPGGYRRRAARRIRRQDQPRDRRHHASGLGVTSRTAA